jgi:hypothetical protein
VPVTAKLSRQFYERLGDDIAGELVDWFNAVDATYQQQLREYNDLNWLRFRAHMDSGFAGVRREVAESRADMIKWMFIFWCGNMIGLGGLIVGLKLF